VISTVARLVEKKGHEWSLRALSRVKDQVPNIRYLIAGSGPKEDDLKRLVEHLRIADNVRFLGMLDDREVLEVYRRSDVFVLPSTTASDGDMEGQALVLQEAQATGLPVVSTLHNGIPEGVVEGETGFLVSERDADSLADRILRLALDADLRTRMGRRARDFVQAKYEISEVCRQLVGIYERALAGTRERAG
jgi:colanic acid/amylovoran biosynthesis glycosyltransferase